MGSLRRYSFDLKRKDYFARANIYAKEDCQKCWAEFCCSVRLQRQQPSISRRCASNPHKLGCELRRKNAWECAIMMKAAKALTAISMKEGRTLSNQDCLQQLTVRDGLLILFRPAGKQRELGTCEDENQMIKIRCNRLWKHGNPLLSGGAAKRDEKENRLRRLRHRP